jgi:hypothetical protein
MKPNPKKRSYKITGVDADYTINYHTYIQTQAKTWTAGEGEIYKLSMNF